MTDTTEYTWTPALDVPHADRVGKQACYVSKFDGNDRPPDCIVVDQYGERGENKDAAVIYDYARCTVLKFVSLSDLLIRQPLISSTDEAFRRGYSAGWSDAADWIDNGQPHGNETNYAVIDAVVRDLRAAIPTPTEAADGE